MNCLHGFTEVQLPAAQCVVVKDTSFTYLSLLSFVVSKCHLRSVKWHLSGVTLHLSDVTLHYII